MEEARQLIRKFSGEYPKRFMKEICQWLTINPNYFPESKEFIEEPVFTEEYFKSLCDTFRSPHLWYLNKENKFSLRHQV